MDVAGAAIATVFAQFVSVVCSVVVLRKQDMPIEFSREQCRIYKEELGKILNVGIPIALQETTVQISFLVVNSVINQMGLMPSAGYGIAQKIVSFIMLVPSSIMQSVSAFVAQNIGAGKKSRAWKGFYTAIITGCSVGIIIFMVGFFGGGVLSSFFTNDSEVIAQSAAYLKGFSADCILTCVLFSSIGYFNGLWKKYSCYDPGNHFRILHPNSGIYHYVEITGNISDLCWNGDTYHNCIWNYLFCNLFPAVK